jgi:hypothetical protein
MTLNVRNRSSIDDQMLGDEPEIGEAILDPNDFKLRKAYNYYTYYFKNKPVGKKVWEPIEWIVEYIEKNHSKELASAFKKVPDGQILPVWAAIARMHNRGTILPKQTVDRLNKRIVELVNAIKQDNVIEVDFTPKKTVQDHILNNASELIGEIEEIVDELIKTGEKPEFSMYKFLTEKKASNRVAAIIGEHFKPQIAQISSPDAKEYFSHLSKIQIKHYVEFFSSIVSDCERFGENKVTARKPRKKKVKSASSLTTKVNYQKEDINLKIASIDPSKIVGAKALYMFNTKTSALTVLHAKSETGLTVKGTTVYDFDPETSITKKAGRAKDILPEVVSGGKVTLRRIMDGIKAKASTAVGRIGSDTVLLRVL